jgi:hypothetical protein
MRLLGATANWLADRIGARPADDLDCLVFGLQFHPGWHPASSYFFCSGLLGISMGANGRLGPPSRWKHGGPVARFHGGGNAGLMGIGLLSSALYGLFYDSSAGVAC